MYHAFARRRPDSTSPPRDRPRPTLIRCSPISGGRGAEFLASSRLFGLKGETSRARKKQNSAIIAADVRRFSYLINTDEVFGTDSGRLLCSKRIHLDGLRNLYEPLLHELYRPCHRVSIHLDVRQQIVIDPAVRSRGSSA